MIRNPGLPPSVLEETRTNISQLRTAVAEGSSITLRRCVTYLLSQAPVGTGYSPVATR